MSTGSESCFGWCETINVNFGSCSSVDKYQLHAMASVEGTCDGFSGRFKNFIRRNESSAPVVSLFS
jgi:hypothetical protein